MASSTTAVSTAHTTTLSNAMVIRAKNNAPKKQVEYEHLDNDATSCGLLEEGEGEEREAALSSPIKRNQRLTSKVSHILVLKPV
jgi:hypothetical protein